MVIRAWEGHPEVIQMNIPTQDKKRLERLFVNIVSLWFFWFSQISCLKVQHQRHQRRHRHRHQHRQEWLKSERRGGFLFFPR